MTAQHDLLVIGGGPGGYVAAIRAAQLGLNVGCVEREAALGGTCLRVGCIPSKVLLETSERYAQAKHEFGDMGIDAKVELNLPRMMTRKGEIVESLTGGVAFLFKKNRITRYQGHGRFVSPNTVVVTGPDGERTEVRAKNVIIATGSKSAPLRGVELDGDRIGTSTEALSYPEVPRRLIVIGAGVIGLELGSVWQRLGAEVTVVEYLDRILPGADAEVAKEALRIFKKQGLIFHLGEKVIAARRQGDVCQVEREGKEPLVADRVLLCTGRVPNTDNLGLEDIGLALDNRGRIPVDHSFATSVPGVYAIGDVIAGPMLAHKAEEEGVACVEKLVTGYGHVDYDVIPSVVYTEPEVAWVGKTEEELREAGIKYRVGKFPFQPNGRAKALGTMQGRVKILADEQTDRVLGVHILGPRAGDLIAECALAMAFKASAEDIARTCHAHPTLAEVVKEAALAVDGRALHA